MIWLLFNPDVPRMKPKGCLGAEGLLEVGGDEQPSGFAFAESLRYWSAKPMTSGCLSGVLDGFPNAFLVSVSGARIQYLFDSLQSVLKCIKLCLNQDLMLTCRIALTRYDAANADGRRNA